MAQETTTGIDSAVLTTWITSLGHPVSGTLQVTRIGMGQSNLTFLLRDEQGARWVLRRPPFGTLLSSAHDVLREARVLTALHNTSVPVPTVYATETFDDVPVVLMDFVDGLVVEDESAAARLSEPERNSAGLAMARVLGDIHSVDLETTGLADLAGGSSYAQRQLRRWSRQWTQSKTRESATLDDLTTRLWQAAPLQHETTLVHGDYHLRNVILDQQRGGIGAVLDWELCTLGDPLADLGTLLAYWPRPGDAMGAVLSASVVPGFPERAELIEAYLARTGRSSQDLAFWHALGLWKLAIIGEGVLRRAADNPENKAVAGTPTLEQVDSLTAMATNVADSADI